jgi:hypothetical protein
MPRKASTAVHLASIKIKESTVKQSDAGTNIKYAKQAGEQFLF